MSASDKKKLRKEQTAAATTEKQRTEQKQQKKLKAYSLTFIVAMILVVATVLVATLQTPVKNVMMRNTTSVTINNHEISAAEFNYFYVDAISNFYSTFDSYGQNKDIYFQLYYGFYPNKPLDDQVFDKEKNTTWADHFMETGIESAKWTYTMYDKAVAAGHKLTEDEQKTLDATSQYLGIYASIYGYGSTDAYLKTIYGSAATLDSYLAYSERSALATSYATAYMESLEFKDEDFRAHEKDKLVEFNSYTYATYTFNVNTYLKGGTTTKDENGKETTTYSDEEKKAAQEAALAAAEEIAKGEYKEVLDLNGALGMLFKSDDFDATKPESTATEITRKLYSALSISNEDMKKWVTDEERQLGDVKYFTNSTKTDDKETINSYTVVLFLDRFDNKIPVGTVRHLLVKFEGGTKDKETNQTVYSDAEKAKAKEEAEKLLKEFQEGEKVTEEAFIELVKKHSDDTGSKDNGGLIEKITPDSGYVKSFTEWGIAEHKAGDVEIIESEYGYHIMYYVEADELNYRDMMINAELVSDAYKAWEEETLKATTVTKGDMKFLNRDYVIAG